jgi:exosortase
MDLVVSDFDARTSPHESADPRLVWWQAGALSLLIGLLYYSILRHLVLNWLDDPNLSFGFFIPVFSGFVVWQDRKRLSTIPILPSWWGLVVIAGALAILMLGVSGAEVFLSRSSFILLLAGLVIYFLGWHHFRAVLFPWSSLFLMIPLPAIVFTQVAFPLQLLASWLAGSVLAILGVPVLREGNVVRLPAMSLEVAQACSGIRSLMSLGALATIYGHFLEPKMPRRIMLSAAAIPIAILANALRIVLNGFLVHYWEPGLTQGFFHALEGWVIFVLAMGMLLAFHGIVRRIDRWREERQP